MNELLFQEFLANRIEVTGKKKINTDRAVKSLRKKIHKWEVIGYNVDAILQHAIDLGWRGLFLPKGMEPRQKHLQPHKSVQGAIDGLVKHTAIPKPNYAQKHAHANQVRVDASVAAEHGLSHLKRMKEMLK